MSIIRIYPLRNDADDNFRDRHRRYLQAWGSVLYWANESNCDRVLYRRVPTASLRFFSKGESTQVDVPAPTPYLGRRIENAMLREQAGDFFIYWLRRLKTRATNSTWRSRIEVIGDDCTTRWEMCFSSATIEFLRKASDGAEQP